jgi:hypothetical protein
MKPVAFTLLGFALAATGCGSGGDEQASERCSQAAAAYEEREREVEDVQARKRALEQAQRETPFPPSRFAELEREEVAVVRRAAQIILAEPECFSVSQVANAREYLEQSQ